MPNRFPSIEPKASSHDFLTFLACNLPSDMLRCHSFKKILPRVCSEMENLELFVDSLFVVAITAS